MSAYWVWWIAAAVLVGAELVTGTFYLLVVGIAAALGGMAAWLGAGVPIQFLLAGGCAFVLTFVAHQWRLRQAPQSPEVALDVGQMVQVQTWNADGTARVEHRGTQWDAELASPDTPREAALYIVATRGSVLILSDRRPAA
jgi:membrane protein implicated in regulation of membrane protease activity